MSPPPVFIWSSVLQEVAADRGNGRHVHLTDVSNGRVIREQIASVFRCPSTRHDVKVLQIENGRKLHPMGKIVLELIRSVLQVMGKSNKIFKDPNDIPVLPTDRYTFYNAIKHNKHWNLTPRESKNTTTLEKKSHFKKLRDDETQSSPSPGSRRICFCGMNQATSSACTSRRRERQKTQKLLGDDGDGGGSDCKVDQLVDERSNEEGRQRILRPTKIVGGGAKLWEAPSRIRVSQLREFLSRKATRLASPKKSLIIMPT
ncbi:hypothetical protein G5I_02792 [Acromyrmex echinatior]|uniref:Uncharacterized protein n=1 Tax=Acromyrmex echinatior TaxID=103372 RepID=F4WB86_ACREC|nr:hypothetical protein G5I_02792 [Acromyrmex echinatior]